MQLPSNIAFARRSVLLSSALTLCSCITVCHSGRCAFGINTAGNDQVRG